MKKGIIISKEEAEDILEAITLTLNQNNLTNEYRLLLETLRTNLRIVIRES